jgi:hypothetical protein
MGGEVHAAFRSQTADKWARPAVTPHPIQPLVGPACFR